MASGKLLLKNVLIICMYVKCLSLFAQAPWELIYIYVMLTLLGLKVIICKIKKNRNFNHLQMLLRTMSILLSFLRDPEFNPRLATP